MTAMNFETAINALLDQLHAASPKERDLAVQKLRHAISAQKRPLLRLADPLDETDPFDNVPI